MRQRARRSAPCLAQLLSKDGRVVHPRTLGHIARRAAWIPGTTSASGEPSLQPAAAISVCTVCPPSFVPRRGVWHGMRLLRRNGIATLVPVRSGPLAGPVSGAEPSRERPRSGRLAGIAIVSLGSALFWCLALAVLDIALWDAHAKHLKQPLVRLLGGEPVDLPAYASFGMDGLEDAVRLTTEAVEQGFSAVKIKVGYEDFADDLAVVRAVKRAIGDASLLIDYNQSLNVPEAIMRCGALDDEGLTWIVEPTSYDNTAGHAEMGASIRTPLQLGENLWGPQDIAESIRHGASDLMMPDLIKVGGVTGWLRASAICHGVRMPVSNHFFQETSAHLMAVTPTAQFVEYFDLDRKSTRLNSSHRT